MRHEINRAPFWAPKAIEDLKRKGCGLINCRSRLGDRHPVSEEIQRIIERGSGAGETIRKID